MTAPEERNPRREHAFEQGRGYQTMINEALCEYLTSERHPLDEETPRKVLREELKDRSVKSVKGSE